MFNRTRIARAIAASLVIITISAIAFASPWSEAMRLLGFAAAESADSVVKSSPAAFITVGTCGEFGGLAIEVEGTGGTNASYATLKAAFDAINSGTHTGTITIDVCANTTETASAVLNASGSGAASYTSIAMSPVGTRTISGSMLGAMIDFNGADNVTIDGLNSGGNSLEIDNQNTGASYTVRFIGDASGNTIQNSTIRGANSANATAAVIVFSTGTTTGNDNNSISNNSITSSIGGNPQNAIYSSGTSAAIDNSGNTISGNNISDYFNPTNATNGIFLASTGNSAWSITNNRLFQTATRVYTAAGTHNGINIGVGSGYTISGNTIGFANSAGTGTTNLVGNSVALTGTFPSAYTTTGTANATRYIAINVAFTAGGTVSEIQGNTIAGFALYTSSGATTTNGILCGINITSGNANIGTTTGNTVGATSGQGSIYTANTSGGGVVVGIYSTSTNAVTIQNNTIGAIDSVGTTATISGAFTGIDTAGTGGVYNISSNIIGNSTSDNIRTGYTLSGGSLSNAGALTSTTGTTSPMVGIRNSATGSLTINSNTLRGWVNGTTSGGALTGITSTGANATSVTINSNFLGTSGLGWMRWAFANTGGSVTGINMSGVTTATSHSIQSNDFRGLVYTVSGTSSHTYISKTAGTAAGDTSTISNNTFTNLSVNTTGSVTFISQSYTASSTSTKNTNNNSIVTAFAKPGAGGTVTFITDNGSTVSGAVSNCQNNNFSNGTLTGATAITGFSYTDGGTAPTRTVTGNTLSNWTTGASAVNMMNFTYWNGTSSLSNNTISSIAGQSTITGITLGSAVSTATSVTVNGNSITGLSSTGTGGTVTGITNSNTSTAINITSNTINNLSTTATTVVGIVNSGSTAVNINSNTINTLSVTGASGTANGITVSGGTTVGINKNKIYDLIGNQTGSIVNGLNFTTGTTFNISNNLIGDLRATAATGLNAINGINASASSTYNVFHNSIYLNATSTGATFGNSCITFSSTATTLNLRNNVLVNTSTPGTEASNLASNGIAATLRRSSGTAATVPTNYNTASNNNDFWVNPAAGTNNHTTYVEGTSTITNSMNTIAQMKLFMVNRDQASFAENPTFLSTTGSSANFLHINTTVATQIESGGGSGTGITDDYDGQTRNVSTPDVGADEFNGIGIDLSAPVITYSLLGNGAAVASRAFSAVTVTDATGVNGTAGTRPRVYYKKSSDANNTFNDNTSATTGWKYVEANGATSPFDFTIDYTLLNGGSVSVGDTIQYFVVAQDTVTPTPNVGINSGSFAATPTSVALTAAAFPIGGSINTYNIVAAISGPIALDGTTYTSLTNNNAQGIFNAINSGVVTGNITITLSANSTGETGAIALNEFASPYTITIIPSGIRTVSGALASNALIRLNGADRVTIDGSNGGGGTDRSLTITNTATTAPTAISLISLGTGAGATNNTIKNTNISTGSNAATSYGIWVGSSTIGTAGDDNDNLTIQNNAITKAYYGIRADANATGLNNSLSITGNNIGSATVGSEVLFRGISMSQATGATISNNTIFNLIPTTSVNPVGIEVGTGVVFSTFNANNISEIAALSSGGYGGRGITINTGSTTSGLTFSNNSISNVRGSGWSSFTSDSIAGILIGNTASTTGGIGFYYNSVNLGSGTFAGNSSGTLSGAFVIASSGVTSLDVRDNVFATNLDNSAAVAKSYAIYSAAASSAFIFINHNDYYVSGAEGVLGFLTSDRTDLLGIQTGFGQNANSINVIPQFNSAINLQPQTGSLLLLAGTPIIGITTDILGATRNVTTPTIGAYEVAVDTAGPSITYTALGNTTGTGDRALNITVTDATGVPTSGAGLPVIYYRKNAGAYVSTQCTFVSGSSYSCTLSASSLGGLVATDTVSYYVAAQDTAPTPNVSTNPSVGAGGFSASPPAASTPPTTPNSYLISAAIGGTKTVCASGCDYTGLTTTGGVFADINAKVVTGNISIEIADNLTSETGAVALNAITEEPANSNFTVKIYPTTTSRTISGSLASNALVRLNGADRITIDGSIGGTGTDRSLTITNTATTAPTAISMISLGTGAGATSNTVKNTNISTGVATSIGYGISVGGSTPGASGADNDNTTIQNNVITVAPVGLYANGTAAVSAGGNDTLNVVGNSVDYNGALASVGIQLGNSTGASVTGNSVSEQTSASQSPTAISLETGFVSSSVTGNLITKSLTTNTGGYGGRGITVGTGTAASNLTIANNVIYGVNGSNWSGFSNSSSMGIVIGTVGSSSTITTTAGGVNLYFNSVSMTGSIGTSGTARITTALYVGSGASALDIRNNIFANTQIGTDTTQKNYAIYSAAANTAFTTINYNDYYVSNTFNSASAIFGNIAATDRTTLGAVQTGFGGNGNSIVSDPAFNVPASDLRPQLGSLVVGAGQFGTGITVDFLSVARNNPPTIGAYENAVDVAGPAITYTAFGNTTSTGDRTLAVTVTDASGVPTTGVGRPVIYYRKNLGTWFSTTCVYVSGSSYNCDIVSAVLSGVTTGDSIQYYVAAQDNLGNVAVSPSAGAGGFTANPPAAATPPTTPSSYLISTGYSGTYNVGSTETITSLTNTGGLFQLMNGGVLTGNVTINITSDLTGETGTFALNQQAEEGGGAGTYTVTIKPSGAARSITSTTTATGLITLNGADRVTIDGSLSGGTDRSLTLINQNSTTSGTTVVGLFSTGIGAGAVNNTIKNTIVQNGAKFEGSTTNFNFGIYAGSGASATSADIDNLTIQNNLIQRCNIGIQAIGFTGGALDNLVVQDNTVGGAVLADYFGLEGMVFGNATGATVTGNTLRNALFTAASDGGGIFLSTGFVNSNVTRNTINNLEASNSGGYGMTGIYIATGTASSNVTIANNFVYDIRGTGWTSSFLGDTVAGIRVVGTNTGGVNIWNNSVNLYGSYAGVSGSATVSAALMIHATTPTALNIRNNILVNTFDNNLGTGDKSYAIYTTSANTMFSAINFNDYLVSGSSPGVLGAINSTDATTLAALQTATSGDANSISADPLFTSSTDLHIQVASPAVGTGTPIGAVTVDYDNDPRPASAPDIGADEIVQADGGTVPAGSFYNASLVTGNTLAGNISIANTLYLLGEIDAGSSTVSLGCNATVVGAGPSTYIVGAVTKEFCSTGSFTFPIGTVSDAAAMGTPPEYTPMTADVTSGTFPSSLTASVIDGNMPGLVPSNSVSRYWNVTKTGTLTADMTFQYLEADINGNENNYKIYRLGAGDSIPIITPQFTIFAATNQARAENVSNFSLWGISDLAPTAADASLSGRVTTADGRGIKNAVVVISGNSLAQPIMARTGAFGYYRFDNLEAGEVYVVTINSKRFTFAVPSRVVSVPDSVSDIDFVAMPE